jgi:simple sugar transport system substrate-binding protein
MQEGSCEVKRIDASRRWRKVGAGLLALIGAAAVVAGCGGNNDSKDTTAPASGGSSTDAASSARVSNEGGDFTVAYVCATASQQPFFVPIQRGAEDAAKAYGVKLNYTGLTDPNGFTAPIMTRALQVAVNQKPDAIVACDFFPPSEDPVLKAASDKGIPVFISNSTSPESEKFAVASFAEDNHLGGIEGANRMAIAGVKHGLCVNDNPGNPVVTSRCTGFREGAKAAGIKATIKTLPQGSSSNATVSVNAVKGALAQDPSIDGVVMMGPVQGPSAVLGVQQAGRAGKVKVGTFDLSSTVIKQIKDGTILFGIWQEPYLQGFLPVQAAAYYLRYGLSPTGAVGTGPTFVTKDNVSKVEKATEAFGG